MDALPYQLRADGEIARAIIRDLDRAYTATAANHDPEIGNDGYTFGTGVWRSSWFFLAKTFDAVSDASTMRPGNAFYIRFPFCNLYFYRDRTRGAVNTSHPFSGPSQVKDSIALNNQVYFGFVDPSGITDENGLPNLVVLHRGNPTEALSEAYIGLPLTRDELADSPWVFIEKIYAKAPSPIQDESAHADDVEPFSSRDVPEVDLQEEPGEDGHDDIGES